MGGAQEETTATSRPRTHTLARTHIHTLTALFGSFDAQLLGDVLSWKVAQRRGPGVLVAVVQVNLQGGARGGFEWIGTRRTGMHQALHGYKGTPGHVCSDLWENEEKLKFSVEHVQPVKSLFPELTRGF